MYWLIESNPKIINFFIRNMTYDGSGLDFREALMREDQRRAPRHSCRVAAQVRIRGKNYPGFIVDVSETGVRVVGDQLNSISTGERVELFSEDLGWMTGGVRWRGPGAIGLKLEESSNTRAKFEAF